MTDELRDVHVTRWGSGPPVVLVHGGTPQGGAVAFAAQEPLAQRWTLLLPDRPGHGGTPAAGREDFERDADLLLPLLDPAGAHLVGHSYGAVVALVMAARRPEAVRSLIVIEPPAFCFARDTPVVAAMAKENRRLFEDPPDDPAVLLKDFFALTGIPAPTQLPDPLPPPLARVAASFGDIRGPYEAEIDAAPLRDAGFPMLVLTSGRVPGFDSSPRLSGSRGNRVDRWLR